MKSRELVKKYPIQFLPWNLNEDTDVFWADLSVLEDNDLDGRGLLDPWNQKINLRSARRIPNSAGDTVEYHLTTEFQNYPVELIIVNE